jgi:hypothetical protein
MRGSSSLTKRFAKRFSRHRASYTSALQEQARNDIRFLLYLALCRKRARASAQNVNVDFGNDKGIPSNAFGAAATQSGFWNNISAEAIAQPLSNLAGSPTTVTLSLMADNYMGTSGTFAGHTGELLALLDNNFFSIDTHPWSLSTSGLSNGTYDFYYYGPGNSLVDTGSFTVNGIAASSIPGSASNTFDQGVDWQVLSGVTVVHGTLTVIPTTNDEIRGLAGFQIVVVPEPSVSILAAAGALISALFLRRRK